MLAELTPHDELVAELIYKLPYSTIPSGYDAREVLDFLREKLLDAYEKTYPEYITEDTFATGSRERFHEVVESLFGVSWRNEVCHRVSGNVDCAACGKPYWRHPKVTQEVPTLVRGCDGRLLKL